MRDTELRSFPWSILSALKIWLFMILVKYYTTDTPKSKARYSHTLKSARTTLTATANFQNFRGTLSVPNSKYGLNQSIARLRPTMNRVALEQLWFMVVRVDVLSQTVFKHQFKSPLTFIGFKVCFTSLCVRFRFISLIEN